MRAVRRKCFRTWLFTLMLTCSMFPTSGLVSSASPIVGNTFAIAARLHFAADRK